MASKAKATKKASRKISPRKGIGFEATNAQREAVSAMAVAGVTPEHIARCIFSQKTGRPISRATLYRHFSEELVDGGKAGTARAIGTLFRAMNGDGRNSVTAAIFWLKTREHDLFAERRIRAIEDHRPLEQLSKISPERTRKAAENVLKVLDAKEKRHANMRRI